MVYSVLKYGKYSGKELAEDEEWGYEDTNKEELDTFQFFYKPVPFFVVHILTFIILGYTYHLITYLLWLILSIG